jgi:hypothetical protein
LQHQYQSGEGTFIMVKDSQGHIRDFASRCVSTLAEYCGIRSFGSRLCLGVFLVDETAAQHSKDAA